MPERLTPVPEGMSKPARIIELFLAVDRLDRLQKKLITVLTLHQNASDYQYINWKEAYFFILKLSNLPVPLVRDSSLESSQASLELPEEFVPFLEEMLGMLNAEKIKGLEATLNGQTVTVVFRFAATSSQPE